MFVCGYDSGYGLSFTDFELALLNTSTGSLPLRISYHLAAFLSRFHPKQVHFEGFWLKISGHLM